MGIEAITAVDTPRAAQGHLDSWVYGPTSQTIWKEMYLLKSLLDDYKMMTIVDLLTNTSDVCSGNWNAGTWNVPWWFLQTIS